MLRIHPSCPWRAPRLVAASCLLIALAAAAFPTLHAQAAGRIAAERFGLPNGLEVLLAPDRTVQVISLEVWYGAGSRDEPSGKGGLARLFERLMFAGSANAARGSHAAIVERVGGALTAEVDEEVARFGMSLPSNRLSLGLWLEADRMRSVMINDTTVGQARLTLLDDLGRRVNDEPYEAAITDAVAGIYDSLACPGYSHPTLGRVPTIAALTTGDAEGFFRERYGPNNARLVVAGDFDPAEARRLIGEYFGGIPRGPDASRTSCSDSGSPGVRTKSVTESRASRVAVGQFFRIPAHGHADSPALELLGVILSQGQGSRLVTRLIQDLRVAAGTQGGVLDDRRGPGVFGLFAIGTPETTSDSLGALLLAQARWAASDELTEAELARARNIYLATAVTARERPVDIAALLHHAATFHGDAEAVNTEVGRVLGLSLADVRRVAKTWLAGEPALTLVITPRAGS